MNISKMHNDVIKYLKKLNINEFLNIQSEEKNESIDEIEDKNAENSEESQENNKNEDEKVEEQTDENSQGQIQDNNEIEKNNNTVEENDIKQEKINNEKGGVGGSDEEVNIQSNEKISQMEIDANFVKNNIEMEVPVNGTITSRFGTRTPTDIISANHAGIDIGAYEGTKILSAMDGKVTVVSGEGDYGNHVKVENDGVSTLYAHCKKIFVKEGDEVKKGTEIAEVGSTGRATRESFAF